MTATLSTHLFTCDTISLVRSIHVSNARREDDDTDNGNEYKWCNDIASYEYLWIHRTWAYS